MDFPVLSMDGPVIYLEASILLLFFFHLTSISDGKNPLITQVNQATAWEVGCVNCDSGGRTKERDGTLMWLKSIQNKDRDGNMDKGDFFFKVKEKERLE